MHEFRLWAPHPARVELVVAGERIPMTRKKGDWWACSVESAGAGTEYAFSLDGGPPRPDPRSPSQPHGVHGPSCLVDHGRFAWTDGGWRGVPLLGSVLYECHIGTFSAEGTFDGACRHLAHLAALGVDAVELLPVAEFPGRWGWGYDGVDLFAPHHGYGGPEGLKRFVDAAHAHCIGVVMDVVYNHLGPAGNYLPDFGPYFSARHQTNWGDAVNFDGPGSDEVRRFVIDNALMWLRDYHCDGLRLDAVHAIVDQSATHILESLVAEVQALAAHLRRPLFVVAETDLNDPRFVRSREASGYGVDAAWADEWHHALHAALTGEKDGYYADFGPLSLVAKALRQAWVYDGTYSPFRGRIHGRDPRGLDGNRFVVFTQNHDQVGNRATGDRLAVLVNSELLRVAAGLLLTSPFVPLLFQGEEWGTATPFQYFTDHEDRQLGRMVSEGRRREFATFGWNAEDVPDPQDPETFYRSKLDWAELGESPHTELLDWYRRLMSLRRQVPALSDPRLDRVAVQFDDAAGWLVLHRGPVTVAANLGGSTRTVPVSASIRLLDASRPAVRVSDGHLFLPPYSIGILSE
jgi:maltooligosyltrehalose trehalohydrolase